MGLFYPTQQDVRNMKRWGYRTYTIPYLNQTIFYLPGMLHL